MNKVVMDKEPRVRRASALIINNHFHHNSNRQRMLVQLAKKTCGGMGLDSFTITRVGIKIRKMMLLRHRP